MPMNLVTVNDAQFSLQESSQLQSILDSLTPAANGVSGGTVELPKGDFWGNYTITNANTHLVGNGAGTVIHGSVLGVGPACSIRNLTIRGYQRDYALKLYKSGGGGTPQEQCPWVWKPANSLGWRAAPIALSTCAAETLVTSATIDSSDGFSTVKLLPSPLTKTPSI